MNHGIIYVWDDLVHFIQQQQQQQQQPPPSTFVPPIAHLKAQEPL
jgi:hypothetical protein